MVIITWLNLAEKPGCWLCQEVWGTETNEDSLQQNFDVLKSVVLSHCTIPGCLRASGYRIESHTRQVLPLKARLLVTIITRLNPYLY